LILTALLASAAWAQVGAGRTIVLTWTDPANPVTSSYSVYRGDGACSTDTAFARITSGLAVKTYQDIVAEPGLYCYRVTASYKGLESGPSNAVTATIPLAPPAALSVIVK
jgi:hypothetical protein